MAWRSKHQQQKVCICLVRASASTSCERPKGKQAGMGNCCSVDSTATITSATYYAPHVPPPTRHDVTCAALCTFLENTFTPSDGIAISVFNESFTHVGSGNGLDAALLCLREFARVNPAGETRLYDSIADAIAHFRVVGECGRTWVLVVITDGEDNQSRRFTARTIGDYVRRESTEAHSPVTNPDNANYVFVVGVGLSDTGVRALRQMVQGDDSDNFLVVNVANFGLLQACMTAISLRVTMGIEVDISRLVTPAGIAEAMRLTQTRRVRQVPMDYYFLLDCSASMTNRA